MISRVLASPQRGLYYGLFAALAFSLAGLAAKLSGLPAQELILSRSVFTVIAAYQTLRLKSVTYKFGRPENAAGLWTRSIAGYIAMSALFYTLLQLPLGLATVLQNLAPVFTGIFAVWVLNEPLKPVNIICLVCCLFGVAVITGIIPHGTPAASLPPLALLAGLVSAILSAFSYVLVRKLTQRGEPPEVVVFHFASLALLGSLIGTVLHPVAPPDLAAWLLLLAVGLTSYLGQLGLTYGLQAGRGGEVTLMLYLAPVLATIWGMLCFGDRPDLAFYVGAALILGSQLLMVTSSKR